MTLPNLQIPVKLQELIESGIWPGTGTKLTAQELKPILGTEAAQKISPEDDKIILIPPPFHTIADEVASGNTFWTTFLTNVGEIDYEKALIIADFGLGSDSPIILYYAEAEPCVMYLKWSGGGKAPLKHSWVRPYQSFGDFADDVGLVLEPI